MIEVIVNDLNPAKILEIVAELKQQGLKQHEHFDFAYHQSKYDTFGHEPPTRRYTIFTFYSERYATFFALKYSQ